MEIIDPIGRFIPVAQKWNNVATFIAEERYTKNSKIAKLCKERWNSLHNDFKHIVDYEARTNTAPLLQTKHSTMGNKVHAKDLQSTIL